MPRHSELARATCGLWPRSGRTLVAAALTGLALPAAAHAQAATQPVDLAAHRAVYDFKLGRAAGGVGDVTGRMVYELTGSPCEGYTQSMRFVTRTTAQDGKTSITDMRSTSFEDAAAKSLKFNVVQYKDQNLAESTDGDAGRSEGGLAVELSKPAKRTLSLAPDALFPVQHSIALIEAARRGSTAFQADLYDGSDKGDKVYQTTAVIGRMRPPGHNDTLAKVDNADRLSRERSWPVAMSYFDKARSTSDAVPSYELQFLFFENGVVRQLTLDYGDIALKGDLTRIEFIDQPKCDGK